MVQIAIRDADTDDENSFQLDLVQNSIYTLQAVLCEVSSKNNWLCWCD